MVRKLADFAFRVAPESSAYRSYEGPNYGVPAPPVAPPPPPPPPPAAHEQASFASRITGLPDEVTRSEEFANAVMFVALGVLFLFALDAVVHTGVARLK